MNESEQPGSMLIELLMQTLTHWIDPAAQLIQVSSTDIQPGMSGASVQRHRISYSSGGQDAEVSIVTKVTTRQEWNVLHYLNAQQPNVPFAYALDEHAGDHLW